MVVVVAGLLLMAKHRLASRPSSATASSTGPAGSASASAGHDAPDFVLTDLKGNPVKLSDLRGKAVVLNFWATWCPPCKEEIPWLVDLQKRYGAQGLQIVGINMDDGDHKDVVKFASENSINYPVLFGQDKVADLYGGIDYLPTTFYIDRNGVVLDRVFGQPERGEIEKNIQRAIATTPKPVSYRAPAHAPAAGSAALPVAQLAEIR
jgi:cytochrome c biogenesis protein CcmG/thiol:disulfide interchange protein DsbE